MNNLIPFEFDGAAVRVVTGGDGEHQFVASDVLGVLALDRKALERLDDDEKGVSSIHTPGGHQQMTTINESGLYSLILGSRKPEAKRFKKWVTSEVLPAIRKTGVYATPAAAAPTGDDLKLSLLESAVRRGLVSAPAAEIAALRIIGVEPEPAVPAAILPRIESSDVRVVPSPRKPRAPAAPKPKIQLTASVYGRMHWPDAALRVELHQAEEWLTQSESTLLAAMKERGYLDGEFEPTPKAKNLRDKYGWKLRALLGALGVSAY